MFSYRPPDPRKVLNTFESLIREKGDSIKTASLTWEVVGERPLPFSKLKVKECLPTITLEFK